MPAILLASLALVAAEQPPAQPAPTPPSAAAATEGAKVVPYPAAFFAQYRPDTAMDMLNRLPGFTLDGGGGQRGFAGGEGNVRLDGQLPASRGDNMTAILRRIPASSIERIDLVTGGAEGIDMQGQSVIANIIRKPGGGVQVTTMAGMTVYEDRDAVPTARLEVQKSDNGRLLEGIALYFDEPFGASGTRVRGLTTPVNSRYDNVVLNENARVSGAYETPLIGGKVRVNATFGQTETDVSTVDTPIDTIPPSVELNHGIAQIAEAGGRYSRTLAGGAVIEASLFHQYRRNDNDANFTQGTLTQRFVSKNRINEDILRGVVRLPKRGAWAFDGGAETAFNALDSASNLIVNGAPVAVANSETEVDEIRGEVFGTAVWTLSPKFNLQMGLRVEASTITTDGAADLEKSLTFLKPRLVATWLPAKEHLAVLRLERSVDQLSFSDFSASASLTNGIIVSGAPELDPAENLTIEARYEYRFAGRGAFVAAYTHMDIDNVVGRTLFITPTGTIEASDNIGSGTRDFVSAILTAPLDKVGVPGGLLRLATIHRSSSIIDPVTKTGRRFSNETPWEWGLNFSQDIPKSKWRWGVDAFTVGDLVTYLPRETQVGAVTYNVAAWLEYKPAANVTVRFDGLNLTDRESVFIRERYAGDRSSGVVNFRDVRETHGLNGGRGYKLTIRKSF